MTIREQLSLIDAYATSDAPTFRDAGASDNKIRPIHRWVPWIAGFSAQFVEDVVDAFLPVNGRADQLLLDPFAGVGTTLVEGLRSGCNVLGFEINAYAALAAQAKLHCLDFSPSLVRRGVESFVHRLRAAEAQIDRAWRDQGEAGLEPTLSTLRHGGPIGFRSRIPFFSPPVEAKVLYVISMLDSIDPGLRMLAKVALGATMVSVSNYSYEPSLGSRPGAGKPLVENASVSDMLAGKLGEMQEDLEWARSSFGVSSWKRRRDIVLGSYFGSELPASSVSLVVTSPPYMNNYHYVRNTRPQLYWLGLITDNSQLKSYETDSFGKFWQTVRQGPPICLAPELPALKESIEVLRVTRADKAAYGGPGWANYVATYFNDSWRFVQDIERQLVPDGRAVIVVGNSIIQGLEFKVDQILAEMGEMAGLKAEQIAVVRTKRVGNSIVGSSVRNDNGVKAEGSSQLYDAAVILRKAS